MIIVKNKNWRFLCLLLGLCVCVTSCNFGETAQTEPPVVQEENKETGKPATEIIVPGGKDEKQEEDEEKTEDKKTQSKPFWQSETSMHYENLTAVAQGAQQDYRINGAKRGWMSKNGKLYGYYDGCYISPAMLVKEGYLKSGLDTTGYEILLIKGSDLSKYDGVNVPSSSKGLSVFAAVKQNNKYLLASAEGKAGQISQADYTALLAKYNQSHGSIVRLSSASAEYDRILNYIGLYEGKFEDLFVREIRKDNKHAVVVFSPASNSSIRRLSAMTRSAWRIIFSPMAVGITLLLLRSKMRTSSSSSNFCSIALNVGCDTWHASDALAKLR